MKKSEEFKTKKAKLFPGRDNKGAGTFIPVTFLQKAFLFSTNTNFEVFVCTLLDVVSFCRLVILSIGHFVNYHFTNC